MTEEKKGISRRKYLVGTGAAVVAGAAAVAYYATRPSGPVETTTTYATQTRPSGPVETTTTYATQTTAPSRELIVGGQFTMELQDPQKTIMPNDWAPLRHVYDTLVTFQPPNYYTYLPSLAKSWEMSEDARVYTFHLRDDVKFYPSGNPMTADDVIWCFDRVLKGQFPLCKGYIYTKELRKIDDYTVQVELKSPFVAYLAVISGLSDGAIMDSKAIIPHVEGEWGTPECDYGYRWVDENSVGTGPYYRKEWKRGVRIVVERNPYYWGPKPTNDKITFQIVAEAATLQLMLERGDIDTTHTGMPLDIVMQYIENPKPGINVAEHPTFLCLVSHLNPGYAPLADPKVRQAMRAAINYPQIIEKMLRGKALPMSSPLYKEFLGGGKTYYEYDLEKAKKLISESKYPNGFEITKIVASTADPGIYFRDLALVEAGDLAKIGIKVKVEEYDWSVIGERFMDVKYEWGQDYCSLLFIDPEGMLTLIGAPRHGENCIINKKFPWRDEEIDALCDQALGETDIKKREQLYDQVCKLIAERGIEIWDCQMMGVYPYRSNVKNFEPSSWMDLTDYSNTVRT